MEVAKLAKKGKIMLRLIAILKPNLESCRKKTLIGQL